MILRRYYCYDISLEMIIPAALGSRYIKQYKVTVTIFRIMIFWNYEHILFEVSYRIFLLYVATPLATSLLRVCYATALPHKGSKFPQTSVNKLWVKCKYSFGWYWGLMFIKLCKYNITENPENKKNKKLKN